MRRLLLALVIICGADSVCGASFERTFGGPELDRGVFVTATSDGGYVAVGATRSFGNGEEDVYLVKTDAGGELLWSQTYGGPEEEMGWAVHQLIDGFLVAGFTRSFGEGGFDAYLVKTDSRGEVDWSRTYGGEADDRAWALAVTGDGGFALVGETRSSGAGEEDCLLIRTDAAGAELWSRTYGGPRGDRCFSVVEAEDGGFVMAGQTYSEGAGDRDVYVVKTDANGELEWSRTFGGAASDVGHSVIRTPDGSFLVTGYTTSLASEGDDPYLVKLDVHGSPRWTRVLPLKGVAHTLTGAPAIDGGFCLTGFTEHRERGASAALVVKTDSWGRLAWHRELLATSRGHSLGYTVQATTGGGCVFAGHTSVGSAGDLDLLLVEVEPAESRAAAAGAPYAAPSRFTDPGDRSAMLDALPDEPLEIAAVARNLTIHHNLLPHFGVPRDQWPRVRNVWPPRASDALDALRDSGPGDLSGDREITDRLRGGCMAESHLLATLLRHRRIPVRIRAGYFREVYASEPHVIAFWEKNARAKGVARELLERDPERWLEVNHEYTRAQIAVDKRVEHWVAEYWDDEEQSWRLLDANTDFLEAMSDIVVGPHLPRRHFEYAHEAWRKMRTAADFNPDQYAEWPQDGRSHIRAQLLWDFYSLLNHDIAGNDKTAWPDGEGATSAERDAFTFVKETVYDEVSAAELAELDALAELLARDPPIAELVSFYRASEHLRIATLEADSYSLPVRLGGQRPGHGGPGREVPAPSR